MTRRKFVTRTIKEGKVKIFGKTFLPELDASRFDGTRAVFGIYWRTSEEWESNFVYLWGTEEESKSKDGESMPTTFSENGYYKWEWWNQEGRR